jgi:hypothetical protein
VLKEKPENQKNKNNKNTKEKFNIYKLCNENYFLWITTESNTNNNSR